ncbi:MAG: sugar phosphate isomerase/epimerase [Verrucomicrobiota bacterium]|jgi:sugar phosphate isomerase/epimerase|nr:sugar phosphate isomerase/epimerase [Verrucomicrobiota bacterium]
METKKPKLGVITDGISRDFEHALGVMTRAGLEYAELQFLWDKEVGDLDKDQMARVRQLVADYKVKVACISRHNFVGMGVNQTEIGDEAYKRHMEGLKRCIEMAQALECPKVRIMSFRREMILFGKGGAESWVVADGAWDKLLELMKGPVELAEREGVELVLETGNNAMVPSAYLGRKLIDDMGSQHLKILWDPGNCLYANEPAYPEGWEALRGGYMGHLHVKDAIVEMRKATVTFCAMGEGELASSFEPMARGLREDDYDGVVSLESVHCDEHGSFEGGFLRSVETFKRIFG